MWIPSSISPYSMRYMRLKMHPLLLLHSYVHIHPVYVCVEWERLTRSPSFNTVRDVDPCVHPSAPRFPHPMAVYICLCTPNACIYAHTVFVHCIHVHIRWYVHMCTHRHATSLLSACHPSGSVPPTIGFGMHFPRRSHCTSHCLWSVCNLNVFILHKYTYTLFLYSTCVNLYIYAHRIPIQYVYTCSCVSRTFPQAVPYRLVNVPLYVRPVSLCHSYIMKYKCKLVWSPDPAPQCVWTCVGLLASLDVRVACVVEV